MSHFIYFTLVLFVSLFHYKKYLYSYYFNTLIEELIKQATKKINDKKSENLYDKVSAEPSVLEKLLNIDENVAFIMALDMIIAGVDTVTFFF